MFFISLNQCVLRDEWRAKMLPVRWRSFFPKNFVPPLNFMWYPTVEFSFPRACHNSRVTCTQYTSLVYYISTTLSPVLTGNSIWLSTTKAFLFVPGSSGNVKTAGAPYCYIWCIAPILTQVKTVQFLYFVYTP